VARMLRVRTDVFAMCNFPDSVPPDERQMRRFNATLYRYGLPTLHSPSPRSRAPRSIDVRPCSPRDGLGPRAGLSAARPGRPAARWQPGAKMTVIHETRVPPIAYNDAVCQARMA
jgi:hypothetical protein